LLPGPRASGVRLPSASSACCDRPSVGPYIPPGTHAASWRHLDHMEGIQTDGGVGTVLLNREQDPFGAIAADVADLGAPLRAEQLEEAVHHLATAALSRPDQPATGMIDDQREIALPFAPADLV